MSLQQREASRSLLPPMPQPAGLKTTAVVDGSERKVDPANVPEAERTKLVSDPKGGQMVGGQGKVFGDE